MKFYNNNRPSKLELSAALALILSGCILFRLSGGIVYATEPSEPELYSVVVEKNVEDQNCKVTITLPVEHPPVGWVDTVTRSYIPETEVEVDQDVICPCGYEFDVWESNDGELDGIRENRPALFTLSQDTNATAQFIPRIGYLQVFVIDPTPGNPDPHPLLDTSVGHSWWRLGGSCVGTAYQTYVQKSWGFRPVDFDDTWNSGSSGKTWVETEGIVTDDGHYDSQATQTRTYEISWDNLMAALARTAELCANLKLPPFFGQVLSKGCVGLTPHASTPDTFRQRSPGNGSYASEAFE